MFSFIVTFIAILLTPHVVSGIRFDSWKTALITALVLTLLNWTLKPILVILTIPISILTLGAFLLIINALLLWFASKIVGDFHVRGFWAAFWGAMFISVMRLIFD
jgi:putative membrane protein